LAPWQTGSGGPGAEAGTHCAGTFDGWLCWPDTAVGTSAYELCPDFITGFDPASKCAGAGAELFIKFHKATSVSGSAGDLHMTRKNIYMYIYISHVCMLHIG